MRDALATIARGFLLGVGFSIAAGAGLYLFERYTMSQFEESGLGSIDEEAAREDIVLSDHKELRDGDRAWIVGTLKNTGKEAARGLQIEADLYLKDEFVDQYSTYVSGSVAPGESRHFKIACGCKDSPAPEHDSYKLHVRGGY